MRSIRETLMSHCCASPTPTGEKEKKRDLFLPTILTLVILALGVVVFAGTRVVSSANVQTNTNVTFSTNEAAYDWGTIPLNGGVVTKTFDITNEGANVLELYDVQTSCACTTAQLRTNGRSSEVFGMHAKSKDTFEVQPGETAQLDVLFDPAFHGPSGAGSIDRTVRMRTNSAVQPEIIFRLTAEVVPE